jgi:predicted nucleic-acid-binding protein
MIAIDTNILLRYWVRDDIVQHQRAAALLNGACSPTDPAFVSLVVIVEFAWVLKRGYGISREALGSALTALLDNPHLRLESAQVVEDAVQSFLDGRADFADYLIAAIGRSHGAAPTHTFDKTAGIEAGFVLESA